VVSLAPSPLYRKIASLLGDVLIYFGIIVLVIMLVSELNVGPLRFKYVQSGSMLPAIHVGDMAVIYKTEFSAVQPGDVVSFTDLENKEILHRVVTATETCLTTQGDANNTPDTGCVSHINGKYIFRVPWLGYLFGFIKMGVYGLIHLFK